MSAAERNVSVVCPEHGSMPGEPCTSRVRACSRRRHAGRVAEAAAIEATLCDWRMPDDARRVSGAACVDERGHHGPHVIGVAASARSAWLYEVDVDARSLKPLIHADYRPGGSSGFERADFAALLAIARVAVRP